jgi:hypothetical protein
MKKKIFVILILCCILVPTLFLGVYQIGFSIGEKIGVVSGYQMGLDSNIHASANNSGTWQNGFNGRYGPSVSP